VRHYANTETTRLNRGHSITLAPEDCSLVKHYANTKTTRLNRGCSITLAPENRMSDRLMQHYAIAETTRLTRAQHYASTRGLHVQPFGEALRYRRRPVV
jgi:hypothetical protein